MVGCLIAGTKSTYRNGATAVIPKSHLWPHDRAPLTSEVCYAEMDPGDALFTLGSTYHGAGENKSAAGEENSLRTLFAVFAQRDYFRQDQEEILSTPIQIARQLPEDILRLSGYCEYPSHVLTGT
jgi:ectoine hydroxylase-related dioxygenase (phytanoyl-CoA dioxygenase family)